MSNKVLEWSVTILGILFALWLAKIVFGVGIGIISVIFAMVGAVLNLIFSKSVITLAAIGLVVYLVVNRTRTALPR